jgi:hypothetical protein
MANCKSFMGLSLKEKTEFIGKLIHIVQNEEWCFDVAKRMVYNAQSAGIFDDVVINPPAERLVFVDDEPGTETHY